MSAAAVCRTRRCAGCGERGFVDDRFCEACGERRSNPRDRVEIATAGVAGVSDRGHRHPHNEDALVLRSLPSGPGHGAARVAVLCDGVSRTPRPDLASRAAADTVATRVTDRLARGHDAGAALRDGTLAAALAVADLTTTARLPAATACTVVAAVVAEDTATVAWLGDSRAYWLPAGREQGTCLTRDDSAAVRHGAGVAGRSLGPGDPRRHAITAWLGSGSPAREVHVTTLRPATPGSLLLCTDGLWRYHGSPEDLAAVLAGDPAVDPAADPLGAARALVASALERGGHDNITAAVVPIITTPR